MKISTIALLSALALTLAASQADAEPPFFARAPIHAWHGRHFTIIRIDQLERYDTLRGMLESSINAFPKDVAALQDAIRRNRALADALRSHGVQIVNVAAIQESLNGNLIFYLR